MTTLEELKQDLKIVKGKIIKDLEDSKNVNYNDYMGHLGEEKVLLKYIRKLENK